MLSYDSMTPVRIRGKRNATPGEKWRSERRRNPRLQRRPDTQGVNDPPSNIAPPWRKRRQRRFTLSQLEELPTEIAQEIFLLSGNFHLALSSPELSRMLSSKLLCEKMATRILAPVLKIEDQEPTNADLLNATRFLDCRFASWTWFRVWIHDTASACDPGDKCSPTETVHAWTRLKPSKKLLPPKKLLQGPFTDDKQDFLELFAYSARDLRNSPHHTQLAYEALVQAISEGREIAVNHLLSFGLKPHTEHLLHAVIDSGCNKVIVELLISRQYGDIGNPISEASELNVLDPAIWAWIDSTKARGDEKGQWLMDLLQATQHN